MSRPDELVPVVVVTRRRGSIGAEMSAQAAREVIDNRDRNEGRITMSVRVWMGPHQVTFPPDQVKNLLV